MRVGYVLINGLTRKIVELAFAAFVDATVVQAQMVDDAIHVHIAETRGAVRALVVEFVLMQRAEMAAQTGFGKRLVVTTLGIAHKPKESLND